MLSEAEWDAHCARVTGLMTAFVRPFVTPLTMSQEYGSGVAWGSGTYARIGGLTWLLTADHVYADVPAGGSLAHLPVDGGDYVKFAATPFRAPAPIDAAAFVIPNAVGLPFPQASKFLPDSLIGHQFSPVPEETLFWMGFPGYYGKRNDPADPARLKVSRFEQLTTEMKPVLTQVIRPHAMVTHPAFDPSFHVAVHYPAEGKSASDGLVRPLPAPKGMSGSLLWDTNFVRAAQNATPWGPEMARVCGVIWGAIDDPEVIFATKIEHVRKGLRDDVF